MNFTYESYEKLLQLFSDHGYSIADYENYHLFKRCVILRHDIDYDLNKALYLAKIESEMGVQSTYFILLTSDFYNLFSEHTNKAIAAIHGMGHHIGLHFDEKRYIKISGNIDRLRDKVIEEAECLRSAIGIPIKSVSMHRPSQEVISADMKIPGLINTYGKVFFKEFKYLSDSRRRWREAVEEIIKSEKFDKVQILTHAFWYNQEEMSLEDSIRTFVNDGNMARYKLLQDNFTDLEGVMNRSKVR